MPNTYDIILECEPLVIRRRRIFEDKQPGKDVDAVQDYETREDHWSIGESNLNLGSTINLA